MLYPHPAMNPDPVLAARHRALAIAALARPATPFTELPPRLLVVDVERQRLGLLDGGRLLAEYPVSTSAKGIGSREGSNQTPPGWHRISNMIGAGARTGTVFRSREATGETWPGATSGGARTATGTATAPAAAATTVPSADEDLVLTRILWLDGLEEGVNRGPGCDSRDRYIYIHGTNQEGRIGEPASHGCVRMRNADVTELFDLVREGDPVVIAEAPAASGDRLGLGRLHFAGVGGSGMSALAQHVAMRGGRASGSDRSFDRGLNADARAKLEHLGVGIFPQDGSGVSGAARPAREPAAIASPGAAQCSAVVCSTSIEELVPDFAAARRLGVPILHRSELLAHFVASQRTIAVTGTSGKSTTTAMIFEILRGAGRDPSVITGGELIALQEGGLWGNAYAGASDLLAIEADESDGSVVRYRPAVGVVLNLQKDHKEMDEVAAMFRAFRANVREALVVGEAENLAELVRTDMAATRATGATGTAPALEAATGGNAAPPTTIFGFGPAAHVRAEDIEETATGSTFRVASTRFTLPVPGRHNIENALAAIAACRAVGVPLEAMAAPLAGFRGVARRFQSLGSKHGVEVVDDFAHNPAKLAASLRTARRRARRVLAVYQPHGYGPTRFLRRDFVDTFAAELGPDDRLWMLEVFYAGGTATRDFSAAEIVAEIAARGVRAEFADSRESLVERLAAEAREGDLVLVMGARDPSLTELARDIMGRL
ncbi:MAG: L,D-transpeptidase family protein [Candidatus Eisenbacteria bacterium]|nr:L,D-transpeptidase family protein [Candidatus Eisenbacteria bacterium]